MEVVWYARCAWGPAGRLKKPSAKRHLDAHCKKLEEGYEMVTMPELGDGPSMLRCKGWGEVVSPSNPSQACKQHSSACKRPREEEVIDLDEDDEAGSSRPVKCKATQSSIAHHMPSAEEQAVVNKDLFYFIITSDSPFKANMEDDEEGKEDKVQIEMDSLA
eukprot:1128194-Pelagomonas_calceolata.AAC.3